ncbi:MAG: hypothetical protein IKU29_06210 [Parabacteroides sp.]|nr:hypothetical protein [Parabacteroides sp.]
MTKEDEELLLKDLCTRLPYGVKYMDILNPDEYPSTLQSIDERGLVMASDGFYIEIENVKPYLFPMSNMTKEQNKEYINLCETILDDMGYPATFDTIDSLDWLNKNYFDYRGLIPKGLANDATNLNIY